MFVVPPMVIQIIKHSAEYRYNLSSLEMVHSGGAPLGGDVAQQLKTVLGVQDIRQGELAIIFDVIPDMAETSISQNAFTSTFTHLAFRKPRIRNIFWHIAM